jgi:hypothetical protein
VIVQLSNDLACWEAAYFVPYKRNAGGPRPEFSDKAD